jgi:adenine phosphoribosyltransferase
MKTSQLAQNIREIKDFPKPGISFKDITPILSNPDLSSSVIDSFVDSLKDEKVDAVVGVESRGFLFGMLLANALSVPFVPIRKVGKLPSHTISEEYDLEYGSAKIEIHTDAIKKDWNVVIHDDLLATGGTAVASAKLVRKLGGNILSFLFVVELSFLGGKTKLLEYSDNINSLIEY